MAQLAVLVVQMAAGVYKGQQARKRKHEEGRQYLEAANRRKAAMTRDVAEKERERDSILSRAQAVGAFQGGGGVGTSGMTSIMGDLAAEGEYNVMATMWQGLNDADALVYRAEAARREGDAAFEAGVIDGVVSAVSSYAGMGGSFGNTWSGAASAGASMPTYGGPTYGTQGVTVSRGIAS